MQKLTLETIAAIPERGSETISFPSLGIEVEVGEIDAECFIQCAALSSSLGDTAEGNAAVELLLASNAITSDGGKPFNTPDGRSLLASKLPKLAIKQIAGVAMRLSGIGEIEKKS